MPTVSPAATTEGRASERTRTFLKAVIEFNNGAAKLDCTVKNISATGARIDIAASVNLPKEFNLQIPHRGEVLRVQMVWREKSSIGVSFLPASQKAQTAQPARTVADLEAENTRLRARVRELSRRLENLGQDPTLDSGY